MMELILKPVPELVINITMMVVALAVFCVLVECFRVIKR